MRGLITRKYWQSLPYLLQLRIWNFSDFFFLVHLHKVRAPPNFPLHCIQQRSFRGSLPFLNKMTVHLFREGQTWKSLTFWGNLLCWIPNSWPAWIVVMRWTCNVCVRLMGGVSSMHHCFFIFVTDKRRKWLSNIVRCVCCLWLLLSPSLSQNWSGGAEGGDGGFFLWWYSIFSQLTSHIVIITVP